jgi:hypothetical protein
MRNNDPTRREKENLQTGLLPVSQQWKEAAE